LARGAKLAQRSCRNKIEQAVYSNSLLDYALELQCDILLEGGKTRGTRGKRSFQSSNEHDAVMQDFEDNKRTWRTAKGVRLHDNCANADVCRLQGLVKRTPLETTLLEIVNKMNISTCKIYLRVYGIHWATTWKKADFVDAVMLHSTIVPKEGVEYE
jgi:hypothetical protein